MTTWRREQGQERASAHKLAILQKIKADLAISPQACPQVASIRIGAATHASHDFEVEMIIAPGIPLFVKYQSVDEDDRDEH